MYPEEFIAPMRQETVDMGFQELRTKNEVTQAISKNDGTILAFINSVCGCAAGMARPGIALALQKAKKKPDALYSVFAGNDREATETLRNSFHGFPPTSPSLGFFKNGKIVEVVQRFDIEGHTKEEVAEKLLDIFDQHCA